MTHARSRQRRWWVGLAALWGIVSLLALSNAGKADAEEVHFCWGKEFPGGISMSENICFSSKYYLSSVYGAGWTAPICAGAFEVTYSCESKANEGVWVENLNGAYTNAYTWDKSGKPTKSWGVLYTHTPPYWHTQSLEGILSSDPDMSGSGSSNLNVFARGTDNAIWRRNWNGSSWSAWSSIGCCIISGPASVNRDGNKIDVVGRVAGNSVGRWYTTNNGSSWSYENIGGSFVSDPAIASYGSELDVFARDSNNYVWQRHWNGTSWAEWKVAFCCVSSGLGADYWNDFGSRLQVVALNESHVVGYYYSENGGTTWAYENLGGSFSADPDISGNTVSATGWESDLWQKTASMSGGSKVWGAWNKLPGSINGGPGAYGSTHVAGRAADNSITHWWWDF